MLAAATRRLAAAEGRRGAGLEWEADELPDRAGFLAAVADIYAWIELPYFPRRAGVEVASALSPAALAAPLLGLLRRHRR